MEYIVHNSKILLFYKKLTYLEHSLCEMYNVSIHQLSLGHVTNTHSWWIKTLYVSQTMLQSKLISYKITIFATK